MPNNTTYDPQSVYEFQKAYLNKDAKGIAGTMTAGTTTNLDLSLSDDALIIGGKLLVVGANQGDYVDFQVVHPVAGVLATYISTWYVNPDAAEQVVPSVYYPAKLQSGLILRLKYTSTGGSNVWAAVNYDKEKVLY